MTWRIERWRRLQEINDASPPSPSRYSYNDMSDDTVGALLRPKGGQKVTTRLHTTNQTDCAVEINTSLESPWSTKLKIITFNLNRGELDELATIICKWYCLICSTRGVVDTQSFAYQRYTANQTDGTTLTATRRNERQQDLVGKEWFQMVDSHPHIHMFQLNKLMPIHSHETRTVVLFPFFLSQSCSIL